MTSQSQSPIFTIPTELRLEIYTYLIPHHIHLRLKKNKLHISECVTPGLKSVYVKYNNRSWTERPPPLVPNGYERKTPPLMKSEVRARRLMSTWGLHWRCEELAASEENDGIGLSTLLRVCKRMYVEVVDFVARTAEVYITDLETIDGFNQRPDTPCASLFPLSSMMSELHELHLTFKLPLKFCQLLDNPSDVIESEPELANALQTWSHLGETLSEFKNLAKLDIWIDHDDPCSWSDVNERAILAPVIAMSKTHEIAISISLPKLYPRYESENRHFLNNTPAPPGITLHRRRRQEYHGKVGEDGRLHVHCSLQTRLSIFVGVDAYILGGHDAGRSRRKGA